MRVFVLRTGRCGSVTFYKACRHIENYSCGHERNMAVLGYNRLEYPNQHIEVDNRLAWFGGRLLQQYRYRIHPFFYVWLHRDPLATAQSFCKRWDTGLMNSYVNGIYHGDAVDRLKKKLSLNDSNKHLSSEDVISEVQLQAAMDLVSTVNENISLLLSRVPASQQCVVHLESAKADFQYFWQRIGARGNLNAALQEWDVKHNASQ